MVQPSLQAATPEIAPVPAAKPVEEPAAAPAETPRPVVAAGQSQPVVPLPAADPREANAEDGAPAKSRLKKLMNLFGG